jgi:hypothetical protein
MREKKHHIFIHAGSPQTLCGIKDRDGIIFNTGKEVTCKKCIKLNNKFGRYHQKKHHEKKIHN